MFSSALQNVLADLPRMASSQYLRFLLDLKSVAPPLRFRLPLFWSEGLLPCCPPRGRKVPLEFKLWAVRRSELLRP